MSTEANDLPGPSAALWPSLAMIVGGSLYVALWPIYTTLHGPTSFDERGELLGKGTEFWGSMMEGPSGLLIALGLAGSYSLLTGHAGRMARVGFVLAITGAVIPALVDLAILAVAPPLLAPVFGAGLILMAAANRTSASLTRFSRFVLAGLGGALLSSFLWALRVRPDLTDQIDGYGIYGVAANVVVGVGWILFGVSLVAAQDRSAEAGEPIAATSPGP
jgi:hypothetical protein